MKDIAKMILAVMALMALHLALPYATEEAQAARQDHAVIREAIEILRNF